MTAPDLLPSEIAAGSGLTLPRLARELGLDPSTVCRWVLRGVPAPDGTRLRLGAIRRGRVWYTSREAYARWLAAHPRSDMPASPQAPPPRSPSERRRDHDAAMARLRAGGIA